MTRPSLRLAAAMAVLAVVAGSPPWAAAQEEPLDSARARPGSDDGPTEVTVGVYLVDLIGIRGSEQSFVADIAVRAVWSDPRLAGRWADARTLPLDDVWHPALEIVNERSLRRVFAEVVEVQPSGRIEYRQRLLGELTAPMDLRAFPFDKQTFRVQLVSARYDAEQVEIEVEAVADEGARDRALSVTDWSVGPTRTELGTFSILRETGGNSSVSLVFEAERRSSYYVVQVFLPLVMIVLMAGTVFWLDPSIIPTRMTVVVTTMLTLIAYRFALAGHVPRLPYLTRLDYFLLSLTVIVLLTLLVMAAAAYLLSRDRKDAAVTINRWGRVVFPACVITVIVLVWWV